MDGILFFLKVIGFLIRFLVVELKRGEVKGGNFCWFMVNILDLGDFMLGL